MRNGGHDRTRPGPHHLAFHTGGTARDDALMRDAPAYGWSPLLAGRHPYAGGPGHCAGCLTDADGAEVEPVASGTGRH
jgi:hypothetical protein